MPTSKGTEMSLSYVQCFLYLVTSSIMFPFFILHGWTLSGQTSVYFSVRHLSFLTSLATVFQESCNFVINVLYFMLQKIF